MIQEYLSLVPVSKPPKDEVIQTPVISREGWFSGKFQEGMKLYKMTSFPFRNESVRLSNQIYYSLFNEGRSGSVAVGEDQTLLLQGQIDALHGVNYIGTDSISSLTQKLVYIQHQLKARGIDLAVAIVPSKVRYYEDKVPVWLRNYHRDTTNYEAYLDEFERTGVDYFDAVPWMLGRTDSSRYYPKNGLHFGNYAQLIVMDSLAGYLQTQTGKDFPRIKIGSLNESTNVSVPDEDLERYITIFSSIDDEPMAYPEFQIIGSENNTTKVLTVGDSYFMGLSNLDLTRKVFGGGQFWYYNHQIRTKPDVIDKYTSNVDLLEEVEKHDVVLLFLSEANLFRFGFGFVDQLEDAFRNWRHYRINYFIQQINSNEKWLADLENKAIERGISLNEMVRLDAEFLFNQESDF